MFRHTSIRWALVAMLALPLAAGCRTDNDDVEGEDAPMPVGATATTTRENVPPPKASRETPPSRAAATAPTKGPGAVATEARARGGTAPAVAAIGQPAPDFELTDLEGKTWRLSDQRGKPVVLEWFNPECPFVVRHHEKHLLKDFPNESMDQGVVWFAINSGAPGKQGTGREKNAGYQEKWAMAYPILLDETGEVGKKYDAKTTPHMYVIDADGILVYAGGIDDDPPGRNESRINYVAEALAGAKSGKSFETKSKPYGCSVKYPD